MPAPRKYPDAGRAVRLVMDIAEDAGSVLPSKHIGSLMANTNDAFVGGYSGRSKTIISSTYSGLSCVIDSSSADGDQTSVTIEYLTVDSSSGSRGPG